MESLCLTFALVMAACRRMFARSPPAALAAAIISELILANKTARCASLDPLARLIFAQWLCPAIVRLDVEMQAGATMSAA